jgi:hypothetical protein
MVVASQNILKPPSMYPYHPINAVVLLYPSSYRVAAKLFDARGLIVVPCYFW